MKQQKKLFIVSELSWERVYLNIGITSEYVSEISFYMQRFEGTQSDKIKIKEKILLPVERYEDGKYIFCLNIAALNGRTFLNNGKWRIVAVEEEEEYVCYVNSEIAYQFEQSSRIFRYGKGKYAYTISFELLCEKEKYLWLVMHSCFMLSNEGWKRRNYVQEVSVLSEKVKRLFFTIAIAGINVFYQLFAHIFPKTGNRILLMSETKDYLWGNLKAIDNRIKERGLDKEFIVDYSLRKSVGGHESVISWVKLIYKIAKQDFIFVDDYVPVFGFLKLSNKTKLIQVWHAGEGFKAVGYCRFGKEGSPFPVGSCHKQYDYALTGSEKLIKVFAEVFGIEKEAFLPVGMPRLDGFLDEQRVNTFRDKFYNNYPELKNKKIILFAPTYRGSGQENAYYDYTWLDLNEIYKFCSSEYIFMIKMHPFIKEKFNIPVEYQKCILDFSNYPNINDLYYVTDIMITDYSSNYYEYSLLKKPVIFYTPDREIYELSRGVHRSVKECAPGKVCDSFEVLMESLEEKDFQEEKIYQFVEDNFINYDNQATDKVIDQIILMEK